MVTSAGIAGALLSGSAHAQQSFEYLRGLNVPYVPTNQPTVEAMLRIAGVRSGDFVVDLGSGDGRILITAAKLHGARGLGVDLDPDRVRESRENARRAGVADRVEFHQRDLFETDISKATVVTLYLLPEVNEKLRPQLLALKPGTRVVTHDFGLGQWKPDIQARARGYGTDIFFYVVPAQVAGRWRLELGVPGRGIVYEFDLSQHFQEVDGTVMRDGKFVHLRDTHLDGERFRFVLIDADDYHHRLAFEGRVAGGAIEGTVVGEGNALHARRIWRAVRR